MAYHNESQNPSSYKGRAGLFTEAVADKFDLLLGDNLQGRKDYIAENGAQYIDMTDLS